MPKKPYKLPEVKIRKLGRHQALGRWLRPGKIEIDPRLKPKVELEVLLHEFFHDRHPHWTEEKVDEEGKLAARFLWRLGYRKPSPSPQDPPAAA